MTVYGWNPIHRPFRVLFLTTFIYFSLWAFHSPGEGGANVDAIVDAIAGMDLPTTFAGALDMIIHEKKEYAKYSGFRLNDSRAYAVSLLLYKNKDSKTGALLMGFDKTGYLTGYKLTYYEDKDGKLQTKTQNFTVGTVDNFSTRVTRNKDSILMSIEFSKKGKRVDVSLQWNMY